VTHRLGEDGKGQPFIECLKCSSKSYHPMDILHLYCGMCHAFHPIPEGDDEPVTRRGLGGSRYKELKH